MRQRISGIRAVLAVVIPAAAFVGEFLLLASQIPGPVGRTIGASVGLAVALPLAVIVLVLRRSDLPRIDRNLLTSCFNGVAFSALLTIIYGIFLPLILTIPTKDPGTIELKGVSAVIVTHMIWPVLTVLAVIIPGYAFGKHSYRVLLSNLNVGRSNELSS